MGFGFLPKAEPVCWNCYVPSGPVSNVEARLVASSPDKCSVEVWATACDGEELSYCRGMVRPRHLRVRILWLGRSRERHVHDRAKGVRLKGYTNPPGLTIAEAVLTMVAMISHRLGAVIVELQALDNGSGKLVMLYSALGFEELMPRNTKEMPWMEAPIESLSQRCPEAWRALVPSPAEFDAASWMQGEFALRRLKPAVGPQRWKWCASTPPIEKIEIEMKANDPQRCTLEICCRDLYGGELLYCRGVLRVPQRRLKLLWIGRTNSRGIEARWKSKACVDGFSIAQASLGLLCTLAERLGASTIELQIPDNGSGKLVQYFSSQGLKVVGSDDPPKMEAQIEVLTRRCPTAWHACLTKEESNGFDGMAWFKAETMWSMSRTSYAWAPGGFHHKNAGDGAMSKDSSTPSMECGVRGVGGGQGAVSRRRLPGIAPSEKDVALHVTSERPSSRSGASSKVPMERGGSNLHPNRPSTSSLNTKVISERPRVASMGTKIECLGNLGNSMSLPGLNHALPREINVDPVLTKKSPKVEIAASMPSRKADATASSAYQGTHTDRDGIRADRKSFRKGSTKCLTEEPLNSEWGAVSPPAALPSCTSLPSLYPKINLSSTTTREPSEATFSASRRRGLSKADANQKTMGAPEEASTEVSERCATAAPRLEKPAKPPRNGAKHEKGKRELNPADPMYLLRSLADRLRAERIEFSS